MNILETLKTPAKMGLDGVLSTCDAAKQLEDSGDFASAAQVLGKWWQGIGARPDLNDQPQDKKAAILARVGVLSGWLGSMQRVAGSQEAAKDLISESANIFEKLGDDQSWAETRSDLAVCYWREGAFGEARIILHDVLDHGFELEPEIMGKLLLRAVNVEISTKHYDKAMDLINRATLAASKGRNLLRGKLYFHRALIQRGEGEEKNRTDLLYAAVEDYQKASVYYKKAKHDVYAAATENNLGNLYRLLGEHSNAHAHLNNAIFLYLELKNQVHAAQVYECKAQVFLTQQQLDEAEIAARSSVSILRASDERSLLAEALTTLGVVLSRRSNIETAVSSFNEAKEAALEVGDRQSAGNAVLTQIEELESHLDHQAIQELYSDASNLLEDSPQISVFERLQKIAVKQIRAEPAVRKIDEAAWENFSLQEAIHAYEGGIILKALTESDGRVTRAATLLGMSHQNLSLILRQRHSELQVHCRTRKPREVKSH